jgi:hypothetical protein
MSGPDLKFRSIVPGSGISISYLDANNIEIESSSTNGAQGFQGWQGPTASDGFQGFQGWQGDGFQGWQGPTASDGFQGFQGWQGDGFQGWQGPIGPTASAIPLDYIEIYDALGGWEVLPGGIYYVPFATTRFNSNPGVFTTVGLTNTTFADGTGIIASETASYLISYTITGNLNSGLLVIADLWNFTTNTFVPGAKAYLNPNGNETVTASAQAILSISSSDVYGIRLNGVSGPALSKMVGTFQACSFSFIKLKALGVGGTGSGGTGAGAQGFQGPTGPGSGTQGFQGPQGWQGFQGPTGTGGAGVGITQGSFTSAATGPGADVGAGGATVTTFAGMWTKIGDDITYNCRLNAVLQILGPGAGIYNPPFDITLPAGNGTTTKTTALASPYTFQLTLNQDVSTATVGGGGIIAAVILPSTTTSSKAQIELSGSNGGISNIFEMYLTATYKA